VFSRALSLPSPSVFRRFVPYHITPFFLLLSLTYVCDLLNTRRTFFLNVVFFFLLLL
jgi:hypothetical protein